MRIAFLGTPLPAVPTLGALADVEDVTVAVVITNPDRPRGRSGRLEPPAVKVAAEARNLPVWQPERPAAVVDELRALELDAAAVVCYGALLPPAVLNTVTHGFVNLHFSLLPRWRGAAPVHHAIRAGDQVTGLTTFVLDEGMDTGPILDQVEMEIGPEETAGELMTRLAERGAPLLVGSLRRLVAGAPARPQPTEGVTIAPTFGPQDVAIDWTRPAREVANLVRSANAAPGAHTTFRGRRLKVWRARPTTGQGPPGQVLRGDDAGPVVATGDAAVVLTELQPAGKNAMDGRSFLNGYQPVGEKLGG